jgi:hypothetical protein
LSWTSGYLKCRIKDKAQFTGFDFEPKPRHWLEKVLLRGLTHPGDYLNIRREDTNSNCLLQQQPWEKITPS